MNFKMLIIEEVHSSHFMIMDIVVFAKVVSIFHFNNLTIKVLDILLCFVIFY